MEFQEFKNTLKRLYNEHIRYHLKRILLCLFLSVCIAGSTSAIAWLLDPAVKKIFIDKNQTYAWLIPVGIIITFSIDILLAKRHLDIILTVETNRILM